MRPHVGVGAASSGRVLPRPNYRTAETERLGVSRWPVRLVVVAMNIEFLREVLVLFWADAGGLEASAFYRVVVAGLVLIAGLSLWMNRAWSQLRQRYRWWLAGALVYSIAMLAVSAATRDRQGLSDFTILAVAWSPYAAFCLLPLGARHQTWPAINAVLRAHTAIGIVLMLGAFATTDGSWRTELTAGGSAQLAGLPAMYGYPMLLLTWSVQRPVGRVLGIAGWTCELVAALLLNGRGMLLRVLLWLPLAAVVASRQSKDNAEFRWISAATIGLAVVIGAGQIAAIWRSGNRVDRSVVEENIELTAARFSELSTETIQSDGRMQEMRLVVEQFAARDWIVGRGVDGRWNGSELYMNRDPEAYARRDLHIGLLHLVLKGGAVLVLLFLTGPLVLGFRELARAEEVWTLAAAAYLCHYAIGLFTMISSGQPALTAPWILLCLAMGLCASRAGDRMLQSAARDRRLTAVSAAPR